MDEENELILYTTSDGKTRLECRFDTETLWLSLNQIADLFDRDKSVISIHLKKIFEEGELEQSATVALFATVQTEGKREVERQIERGTSLTAYECATVVSVSVCFVASVKPREQPEGRRHLKTSGNFWQSAMRQPH